MTSLHKVCQNSEASRDLVKRVYDFEKGAATLAGLREYIDDENIPRFYGGSAPGSGPDDVLLESELFPEGLNAAAQALKARWLRGLGDDSKKEVEEKE